MVTVGNLVQSGGPGQRHPADDHRVGGPDVRLFRRRRAHRAARPPVDPRRQGQVGPRGRHARDAGAGQRGRISARRDDRLHRQPGQSEDRHAARAGHVSEQGRVLLPGFFARVRVPVGAPHRRCWSPTAPSTPTRARRSSTSSTTRTRWSPAPSALGSLHDGLRAIEEGLKPGERVVVNGLQTVRPGMTVEPQARGHAEADRSRKVRKNQVPVRQTQLRSRRSSSNPTARRPSHAGAFLHRPPGAGLGDLRRHHPAGGHCRGPACRSPSTRRSRRRPSA